MSDSPLDDLCDELGIGKSVPGAMVSVVGQPRNNILIDMAKPGSDHTGHLVVLSHNPGKLCFSKMMPLNWTETTVTVSEIPPPSGAELIAKMQKAMADMNRHARPGNVAERIDMGKGALAELRRQTPTVQASPDDSFALGGIRIFLAPLLDDDQWIAYDRHGVPLALGRISTVKILVPREPT